MVDVLGALTSTETYQLLVVNEGWNPAALIRNVWKMCADSVLIERRPHRTLTGKK